MSDPDSHPSDHVERKYGFDVTYNKSINGILKAKQVGWSFLAFILACFAKPGPVVILFIIATCLGWLCSGVIWFMFSTHNYKKITKLNWFLADIVVSVVACILYVALGIPTIISVKPLEIAAAVFGFVAVLSYGAGTWYSVIRWRDNKKIQKSNDQYQVSY